MLRLIEENSMEKEQFTRLAGKYLKSIYKVALCNLRNAADAEDVTQEAFCALLNSRNYFEDDEQVKRWLIRVVTNKSKDLFRSAWRQHVVPLENLNMESDAFEPQEQELLGVLQQLPLKYRTVIHLYYYEEYSTGEIAQILACSETSVRKRLSRARDKLRMILEEGEWI